MTQFDYKQCANGQTLYLISWIEKREVSLREVSIVRYNQHRQYNTFNNVGLRLIYKVCVQNYYFWGHSNILHYSFIFFSSPNSLLSCLLHDELILWFSYCLCEYSLHRRINLTLPNEREYIPPNIYIYNVANTTTYNLCLRHWIGWITTLKSHD